MKCKHCGEEIVNIGFRHAKRGVYMHKAEPVEEEDDCEDCMYNNSDCYGCNGDMFTPVFEVDRPRLESTLRIAISSVAGNAKSLFAHSIADEIERAVEYMLAKRGLGIRQTAIEHGIDLDKVIGTDPDTIFPPAMTDDLIPCMTCKYTYDSEDEAAEGCGCCLLLILIPIVWVLWKYANQ